MSAAASIAKFPSARRLARWALLAVAIAAGLAAAPATVAELFPALAATPKLAFSTKDSGLSFLLVMTLALMLCPRRTPIEEHAGDVKALRDQYLSRLIVTGSAGAIIGIVALSTTLGAALETKSHVEERRAVVDGAARTLAAISISYAVRDAYEGAPEGSNRTWRRGVSDRGLTTLQQIEDGTPDGNAIELTRTEALFLDLALAGSTGVEASNDPHVQRLEAAIAADIAAGEIPFSRLLPPIFLYQLAPERSQIALPLALLQRTTHEASLTESRLTVLRLYLSMVKLPWV